MALKGLARHGPTFREVRLMHAIARLVLHPLIPNIQASWVQAWPGRRRDLPQRRRQRSGRHLDERKHLARRRQPARPGNAPRSDGSADPRRRPRRRCSAPRLYGPARRAARQALAARAAPTVPLARSVTNTARATAAPESEDRLNVQRTTPPSPCSAAPARKAAGLALRWAHAGYPVIIGSRTAERAGEAAAEINAALGRDARRAAPTISPPRARRRSSCWRCPSPRSARRIESVRGALAGKILIDVTVPLVPPKVSRVQLAGRRLGGRSDAETARRRTCAWCPRSRTSPRTI